VVNRIVCLFIVERRGTWGGDVIPRPAAVRVHDGVFTLDDGTTLSAEESLTDVAGWLRGVLGPSTGCWLPPGLGNGSGEIALRIDPALAREGYRLEVEPTGVRVTGATPAGVFYGVQTLRQLLPPAVFRVARTISPPWSIPAMTVTDAPRFGWRGCMLDVARHFMPQRRWRYGPGGASRRTCSASPTVPWRSVATGWTRYAS